MATRKPSSSAAQRFKLFWKSNAADPHRQHDAVRPLPARAHRRCAIQSIWHNGSSVPPQGQRQGAPASIGPRCDQRAPATVKLAMGCPPTKKALMAHASNRTAQRESISSVMPFRAGSHRLLRKMAEAVPVNIRPNKAAGWSFRRLAHPQHPLTARVMANRVWLHLFGPGWWIPRRISACTCARPSHPALLDHLAQRFMNEGWSLKQFIRAIVLSRTYQLDSQLTAEQVRADPDNQWLARHSRRKLDAESIRDSILAASGQIFQSTRCPARSRRLAAMSASSMCSLTGHPANPPLSTGPAIIAAFTSASCAMRRRRNCPPLIYPTPLSRSANATPPPRRPPRCI